MGIDVIIKIIFCSILSWPHVLASQNYTLQNSLNSFLYGYAFRSITPRPRSGQPYNVRLPLNFSGIQVSIVRLRAHSLWKKGLNISAFQIPTRTLPQPFTNRVDFLYQDLGNWSTFYYNVPNHTFVAPVIGLLAYDRSNLSSIDPGPIELHPTGVSSIVVQFQNLSLDNDSKKVCVRFGANGTLEFTDLSSGSSCVVRGEGHFSVVVARRGEEKMVFLSKGWIVGIVLGLVVLILFVVFVYKLIRWRKVWRMEKMAGRSEGLGTRWIGSSKMPTALCMRTQPSVDMLAPPP